MTGMVVLVIFVILGITTSITATAVKNSDDVASDAKNSAQASMWISWLAVVVCVFNLFMKKKK